MLAVRTGRKLLVTTAAFLAVGGLVTGCTPGGETTSTQPTNASVEGNQAEGDRVVIGFSGPAADHGWL
ncbi:MAG: sugar ABC transporter substrate-binding protein, partial [Cellulosimicrobium cellulans]